MKVRIAFLPVGTASVPLSVRPVLVVIVEVKPPVFASTTSNVSPVATFGMAASRCAAVSSVQVPLPVAVACSTMPPSSCAAVGVTFCAARVATAPLTIGAAPVLACSVAPLANVSARFTPSNVQITCPEWSTKLRLPVVQVVYTPGRPPRPLLGMGFLPHTGHTPGVCPPADVGRLLPARRRRQHPVDGRPVQRPAGRLLRPLARAGLAVDAVAADREALQTAHERRHVLHRVSSTGPAD